VRRYTPLHGPHKGVSGYLHDDGTFEPAAEVDWSQVRPAVAVPDSWQGMERETEAWKRESVSSMQGQMVQHGVDHEAARATAVIAARRSDGERVAYPGTDPNRSHRSTR
jgi:hypothetical protein